MKDKVDTLIGFAIKARKAIFGTDNIEKSPRVNLIVCCKTLSENSLDKIKRISEAKKTQVCIIMSQKPLEDIVYKTGVKAIAITDKQMSDAILKNLTANYIWVREEKPL